MRPYPADSLAVHENCLGHWWNWSLSHRQCRRAGDSEPAQFQYYTVAVPESLQRCHDDAQNFTFVFETMIVPAKQSFNHPNSQSVLHHLHGGLGILFVLRGTSSLIRGRFPILYNARAVTRATARLKTSKAPEIKCVGGRNSWDPVRG